MQFFGNNDLSTTEYIARKVGKTRVEVARSGEVGPEEAAKGQSGRSRSIELNDLLTSEEITRLFARGDELKRELMLWTGHHPMILQRVEYFDEQSPVAKFFRDTYAGRD